MSRFRMPGLWVAAGLLLSFAGAAAAEPPKDARSTKSKPPVDAVMTRAELRQCMVQQDRNKADAAELAAQRDQIDADKATLKTDGDAMKEQLATLDRTSADAVAQYNERVKARDAAVDALMARSDAFNGRVEAAQAARASYASTCGNRRFDERDETAIRNGR